MQGAGPYADVLAGGLEVLGQLSGVGLAVNAMKAAATAQRQLSEWVQRRAEPWLQRSQSLSEEQVLAQLPLQWARDFRQAIASQHEQDWDDAITYSGPPPLIALDTYETLWHAGMGRSCRPSGSAPWRCCEQPGAARRASNNRTLATGNTMSAADLSPMSQQSHQPSLLNRIARVLLCLVFIHAVIGKLTGFAGVAGAISAKGLPLAPVLLVAAMALMAVGSALVISGWKARLGAVLLLVFLVPTTLLFHGDVADKMERIQLFKNLAIMGGLLLVADQHSRA